MTDGGRIARRNGRVFMEECHSSQDTSPNEASAVAAREVKERQIEKKSYSRESSCSDLSVIGFKSEVHTPTKACQATADSKKSSL
jgi:hypothetical protein